MLFKRKKKESVNVKKVEKAEGGAEESILILGSGCAKCNTLEKNVVKALEKNGVDEAVGHVKDFSKIASYGVMSTPALVIDNKVISCGKVLSEKDAEKMLIKAGKISENIQ